MAIEILGTYSRRMRCPCVSTREKTLEQLMVSPGPPVFLGTVQQQICRHLANGRIDENHYIFLAKDVKSSTSQQFPRQFHSFIHPVSPLDSPSTRRRDLSCTMKTVWRNLKSLAIARVGLWGYGYLTITIGLAVPMIKCL
jgi:hypothetical protein